MPDACPPPASPARTNSDMTTHVFPVRVYYEDTDAAGIVYYANYLKFAERARTEVVRSAGISQDAMLRDHKIGFVVRNVNIEFLKPARLDDLLTIETLVDDITKASITMKQTIKKEQEVLVELTVRIAVVSSENGRVTRLPDEIYKALTH